MAWAVVRRLGAVVAALGCAAGAAASGGGTAAPTPTGGPAARAGESIDRAWEQVSATAGEALLGARVRVALLERLKEDGLRVTIEVRGGDVELSGRVEKGENVPLAGRVAASVEGVRSVRSRVTVVTGDRVAEPPVAHVLGAVERTLADALLDAQVKTRLLTELGKVAFEVWVDARQGVVTLSGTVPDADRRRLAVAIATATSGVREVRDQLTVAKQEGAER